MSTSYGWFLERKFQSNVPLKKTSGIEVEFLREIMGLSRFGLICFAVKALVGRKPYIGILGGSQFPPKFWNWVVTQMVGGHTAIDPKLKYTHPPPFPPPRRLFHVFIDRVQLIQGVKELREKIDSLYNYSCGCCCSDMISPRQHSFESATAAT